MNDGHHTPHHWIAVAFALGALLLTITEANGQTPALAEPVAGLLDKTQKDVVKKPERGVAREQRSTVRKTTRAAKSVAKQARTGVSTIDSKTNR